MSENEYHQGSAKHICKEVVGFVAKRELAIKDHGFIHDPDEDENDGSYISDSRFIYVKKLDRLYIIDDTEEDAYGFTNCEQVSEDEFHYTTIFYNGGGCLQEVLEDFIMKQNQNKPT